MMKKAGQKGMEYTINLAAAKSDGSFQCPNCGMAISPDDENDDSYEILDTKLQNDELLELVISCGKCKSIITVTGFQGNA